MSRFSISPPTVCLLLLSASFASQAEPISADTQWKSQTLPNGFNYHFYYIKDEPIELRFLVHAGSVQETEQQSGYAHFLEHMAFNGSQHFPGNNMIAEFEKAGVAFGPGINAYTGYDITGYEFSLPDNTQIEKVLTWFQDIGYGLNLKRKEIEAEKGVIQGEIRLRLPKERPMAMQVYDYLIKDTVLAKHDPNGTADSIAQLDPEQLKAYYQKWYAPNNAELIIVGDFDFAKTEKLVKTKFSDWKAKTIDRTVTAEVTHSQDRSAQFLVLPEGSISAISLNYPVDIAPYRTLEDQRKGLQNNLMNTLIQNRLTNRSMEEKVEYSGIDVSNLDIENVSYNYIDVEFAEEKRAEIQKFIATELANLRDHGVNQSELEVALALYKFELENLESDWEQKSSREIIADKELSLEHDTVYQSMEDYRANLSRFINQVDVAELNQQIQQQLSRKDRIVFYGLASERAKQINPKRWLEKADRQFSSTLDQAGKKIATQANIEQLPTPTTKGEIISSYSNLQHDLTSWKLENGIEVWFLQSSYAGEDVYLNYSAEGGTLLLPSTLKPAVELSQSAFMHSGLGEMNAIQLNNFFTLNNTWLDFSVDENQRTLNISTTQKNLATAFALLHQAATNAKVDQSQFSTAKSRFIDERRSMLDSPTGRFDTAINDAIYGENNSERPSSVEQLTLVDSEQVDSVYQQLFRQKDDFKLIIVADMAPEAIEAYLRQYVANISYLEGQLKPRDIKLNKGQDSVMVKASNEPKIAFLTIFSSLGSQMNVEELYSLDLLEKIVNRRIDALLREERGLDYSPYVEVYKSSTSGLATMFFVLSIDPKQKNQADMTMNELITAMNKGITQEELAIVKSLLLLELEDDRDDPELQSSTLSYFAVSGFELQAYADPEPFINKITAEDINQTWQKLTNRQAHRLNAYLAPKDWQEDKE
ncbi:M16 family metallopeptidase [Vibrio sp.]|uniref:M16 family metallopeptidase n=1 Tax=Vibrio sp. TaxID=678 RepID=UPI003D0F4017